MNDREAIEAAIAAWNEQGVEAFIDFLATDVEWHAPPEFPMGSVWRDRESLAPVIRDQFGPRGVFTESTIALLAVKPGTQGWFVEMRQRGVHPSGMDLDWPLWFVVQLEKAHAKRVWVFFDRESALRQAGIDG